ncbi:hypothetical protein AVEN_211092-1 [Araneus ventricosus]|uniref:H15 domain-containing protein n=1 Tax=Araneus ventricosus TaxID=182803 RepID=A0A4Y2GUF6_ARAVE|nr:hypothetical protein AVEN_211092-1 [Araneus ventricosus]
MAISTAEKAKIRRWMLMAVTNGKGSSGVTIQHIKKFLDSKQGGLSSKAETKLILSRLLETGHLEKTDGKYVIKKSKKKTPDKETKRSKSPLKKPKSTTKNPSKLHKEMNAN